jgi:Cu/Ag efflux protein CusF
MNISIKTCIFSSLFALAGAGLLGSAAAQTDHSMHTASTAKPAAAADSAMGEGVVKKIDKSKGSVTLAHGALPNGMPAMTMAYKVKDVAWLDKMTVGQKIRFATDPKDGDMTVLRFEPVK